MFGIARNGGAWADLVAVPAIQLAPLPDDLGDETAAALPVAGVTALRVLRLAGRLRGRRVLVTGAAGGVGRFAVQLAHAAGAEVTAIARDRDRASGLAALGAAHVVTDPPALTGGYEVILESVGGPSMELALELVAAGGLVVTFGNSARMPATLPVARFYPKQAVLRGFYLLDDLDTRPAAQDLRALADLAATGRLRVDLDASHDLAALPMVLRDLADRRVAGKVVLTMRR